MSEAPQAFFEAHEDVFVGTAAARGPWSVDHCHAGPVLALVARAIEKAQPADRVLTRLAVDLTAPVPLRGIRVQVAPVWTGRSVNTMQAEVADLDGRVCAAARSLSMTDRDIGPVPTAPASKLCFAEATRDSFPGMAGRGGPPKFMDFVEVAYPPGETQALGPKTIWMKALPVVVGEAPSSFQRICPLADSGNGISRNANMTEVGFINPDITIVRHRSSASPWLASATRSDWNSNGIGLATSVISDEEGPVATALQTLLLRKTKNA